MVKVPPGHCWVEGDSEAYSRDSNSYGPVSVPPPPPPVTVIALVDVRSQIPLALIDSRVAWIIWPRDRIQRVEDSQRTASESVKTSVHSVHRA